MARLIAMLAALVALLNAPPLHAQGGPPFFTTDPGTPGNGNWEINVAAAANRQSGTSAYQLPQLDVNLGVGERVQLSAEIPYVRLSASGAPQQQGWSNALLGAKWRFLDQGEGGWQVATFPQLETAGSARAQRDGLASDGPRWLLPLEVAHRLGPLDVNLEAGYYLPRNGQHERFVGLLAGGALNERLELDAELYTDRVSGLPTDAIADVGLRYQLQPAFILLAMAGRSVNGSEPPHVRFTGYLGVQILLSDYGRHLMPAHH